ncbi:hypothetical protein ACFQDN_11405 [Pseudomonas asuensis]|jgi:hypothetical protein|uniref:Uncharacterized protein n=1 Tax=Pseudomonas asuensis TaxID=1825787 RepID=A0ABQ2GPA8_9PSED|nr:hypothetical protein [Pseudomonas asuensis]GGM05318.1 hypothetical protein GCM10009425_15890 [Pseudomonas asuensis]
MKKTFAIVTLAGLLSTSAFAQTGPADPTSPTEPVTPGPSVNSNDVTPGADSGSSPNNGKGVSTAPGGMSDSTRPETMDHGTHREQGNHTGTGAGMGMDSNTNGTGAGSTPGMGPAANTGKNP